MKREEILVLCASNPEVIATYIESLESQIKDLSEKLQGFLDTKPRNFPV